MICSRNVCLQRNATSDKISHLTDACYNKTISGSLDQVQKLYMLQSKAIFTQFTLKHDMQKKRRVLEQPILQPLKSQNSSTFIQCKCTWMRCIHVYVYICVYSCVECQPKLYHCNKQNQDVLVHTTLIQASTRERSWM